ncbi:hypothetical protein GCM10027615_21280 [Plantactinospora veratri]|nr:hypothetical protein C6W10_09155 [Plantactinospora sp. BB1]
MDYFPQDTRLILWVLPGFATRCRTEGWPAMVKKVLTWGGIAFLVFFIAYQPSSAADVFKSLGGSLLDVAQGFGDFFTDLVA